MKRTSIVASCVAATLLAACAQLGLGGREGGSGWVTLIDGASGLDNWNRMGDANWRAAEGTVMADEGKGGYLVSKNAYKDFEIRAEFWAATDTNSGIFVRCIDPAKIAAATCYEVNIWDIRPEPKYGTGAIVNFAEVPVPIRNLAGGKWNTMEITARGSKIVVKLNGVQTVALDNAKFPSGPFALQYALGVKEARGGPIKWRKVQVRSLST
jgi:hypothetical protein